MRALKLAVWAMTWATLGYLWRERVAYRERLPAPVAAVARPPLALPPPPFALPPSPEVIDLPALALPRPDVPEDIDAFEDMVTISAPSAAPAPPALQGIRMANTQRMAHRHSRTAGLVLAVIVTGAAMGALTVWLLSAVPGLV
jgi:hypothetical protein